LTQQIVCDECGEVVSLYTGYIQLYVERGGFNNPMWDFCDEKCLMSFLQKKLQKKQGGGRLNSE